jgi:dolichyl-phosphate-mannose-protein mannosyltransferase
MAELRHRQVSKKKSTLAVAPAKSEKLPVDASVPDDLLKEKKTNDQYRLALIIVTALAFFTRFYLLNYPNEVV